MASLGDLIIKLGVNAQEFDKGLGNSMRKLNQFGKNTKKLGANLTRNLTLPLAAIGAGSFKLAADFEASMAKVKAVSGATASEFAALEKNALDLGSSTKFTATEVSGLQLEFSKLGFSAAEITKVTESTLALAQATGSDLATSAEVAGATLRGFGLDAEETGRVTDVMAASFSSSALDMSSFQDSMKFVAPVAKAAGVSLEETTAMLAALANNGIKGSQAGTALRRIISELGATGGDVAGAIEHLAGEGLNLADAKDEVGRSAQSALLVLSENIGVTDDLAKSFGNAEGTAKDMAGIMDDTAAGSLAKMKSALEGAGIVIGQTLAPFVLKLAGFITDLSNGFKNLSPQVQGLIITFGGVAAALGPILFALPNMVAGFGKLKLAMGVLTGPVGMIAAGFAAAVMSVKAFNSLSNAFKSSSDKLADSMHNINVEAKKQTIQAEALVTQYGKEKTSLEDRKKILQELKKIDEDHFGNLNAENLTIQDLNKTLDTYIQNTRRVAMEKALAAESEEVYGMLAKAELNIFDAKAKLAVKEQELIESGAATRENAAQMALEQNNVLAVSLGLYEMALENQTKRVEEFEQRKIAITNEFGGVVEDVTEDVVEDLGDVESAADDSAESVEFLVGEIKKLEKVEPLKKISTPVNEINKGLQTTGVSIANLTDTSNSFFAEMQLGFENLVMGTQNLVNIGANIGANFSDSFREVVQGTKTAKAAMGDFLRAAIDASLAASTGLIIEAAINSGKNLGPGALIAIPALITAGIGLVRSMFADISVPAMAEGGIVSGNTLVQVGEYAGASTNPEVIAPLDKLKSMLGGAGGGQVQVHGVIRGRDIFLTNEVAARELGNIRAF
tara:strand:+ start:3809 stop:6352 length:2544 start_codon:yes stop_codon:yes gene_type:complete